MAGQVSNLLHEIQNLIDKSAELDRSGKPEEADKLLEQIKYLGGSFVTKARKLTEEGLKADEEGYKEQAVRLYREAVGVYLEAARVTKDGETRRKYYKLAEVALERAECVKEQVEQDFSTKNYSFGIKDFGKKIKREVEGLAALYDEFKNRMGEDEDEENIDKEEAEKENHIEQQRLLTIPASMGCLSTLDLLWQMSVGILLGTWNLISTCINVHYLYVEGHHSYAALSVFFLWFPGVVTSVGFLVLYQRGNPTVLKLAPWKLAMYPLLLLVFYPVIPIILTAAYCVTGDDKMYEKATMAKFFAGFLDHGPNFVLRLVIVVLSGISQNGVYNRGDIVFILSMVSSFGSMVLYALYFNERKSNIVRWIFLATPMYSAIFACRAFTIAVFLNDSGAILCFFIIAGMFLANFGLFRHCGQDWTRSAVFGITSLLLPAGYNNDEEYYQLPGQNVLVDCKNCKIAPRVRRNCTIDQEDPVQEVTTQQDQFPPVTNNPVEDMNDQHGQDNGDMQLPSAAVVEPSAPLVPMKSGKFLFLHILLNTGLIFACAIYVFVSHKPSKNSKEKEDALIIPQILGVIPGLFFSVAHIILMPDVCQVYDINETRVETACNYCRQGGKLFISVIFSILGYCSLAPALHWTFIYKVLTSDVVTNALLDMSGKDKQ